jgi:hypothetical protein
LSLGANTRFFAGQPRYRSILWPRSIGTHVIGNRPDFTRARTVNILRHGLMRTGSMNPTGKKKSETENEGGIRRERDPNPASEDVEEGGEVEDSKGNLPPAMPPGA